MTRIRSLLLLVLCIVAAGASLPGQEKEVRSPQHPGKNPYLGDKQGIRDGMALYRVRCADCHGLDATGYRGPDLMGLIAGGIKDEALFQAIRKGVTGTEMPPSVAPDHELLMMIAYLRNIGTVSSPAATVGNAENGAKLFASQCASCHQVAGKGGRIGPDLSRIGTARSHAAFVREIRTPSEWIPPAFETVTLVTRDGQKIRGVKKNEDVFSIQIMDLRERIQGYLKADLQDVIYEKGSLMPTYGAERLNDGALNDLIGYLTTLRGADVTVR